MTHVVVNRWDIPPFVEELYTRRSRRQVFFVIPPFKTGAGFAEAGIHPLDSRLRGNDVKNNLGIVLPVIPFQNLTLSDYKGPSIRC